jgi:energy-converting hydrogenase Eha subunit A
MKFIVFELAELVKSSVIGFPSKKSLRPILTGTNLSIVFELPLLAASCEAI